MANRLGVADDVVLAVEVTGPSSASVWLQAHGVGSSGRFVQSAFAGPVHASGHRLATYDQRGHGDSSAVPDAARHGIGHQVADLVAVARQVGATIIGGVSLGGHAAVLAAPELSPDAVAVVLPAWTGPAAPGEGPHAAMAERVRAIGIEQVIADLQTDTSMAPWLHETVLTDFRRADADSLASALVALDGARAPGPADLALLDVRLGVVGWPDDPGHPLAVAREWAAVGRGRLITTSIQAMQHDPTALGSAAVASIA